MNFVSRSAWGARAPRTAAARLSAPVGVALHWGGPAVPHVHADHGRCAAAVRGWQNYHMDGHKWADIAYNAVVCPHGYVFEARGLNARSAANGTNAGNASHYAICYLSGEGQPLTDAAKQGIADAREWLRSKGNAGSDVKPHNFFKATGCPGPQIVAWIKAGLPLAPQSLGDRVLGLGDEGEDVEALQRLLLIEADGDFGPATDAAVRAFQSIASITVDGLVGPTTLSLLRASTGTPVLPTTEITPTPIEEDDMRRARYTITEQTRKAQFITDGVYTRWITDGAELADLNALGLVGPLKEVSQATHDGLILVGPNPYAVTPADEE